MRDAKLHDYIIFFLLSFFLSFFQLIIQLLIVVGFCHEIEETLSNNFSTQKQTHILRFKEYVIRYRRVLYCQSAFKTTIIMPNSEL